MIINKLLSLDLHVLSVAWGVEFISSMEKKLLSLELNIPPNA